MEDARDLLFISYAWEDGAAAEWLTLKLTALGYRVWCDRFENLGGENWPGEIDDAIRNHTFRLQGRLKQLEPIFAEHEWLAGAFSIADIMMADVLRFPDRFDGLAAHPACCAYVGRATARPAFAKAYDDQMAHFAAAD